MSSHAHTPALIQRFRWLWLLPAAALTALLGVAIREPLDRYFFDFTARHPLFAPPAPPPSTVVLVDDQSLATLDDELGLRWPFPRIAFAGLLISLERAGARAIVMDFTFLESSDEANQDAILAHVAAALPSVIIARGKELKGGQEIVHEPAFWPPEYRAAHPQFFTRPRTGFVDLHVDPDGKSRFYAPADSLIAPLFTGQQLATKKQKLRWHGRLTLAELADDNVQLVPVAPFIEVGYHQLAALKDHLDDPTLPDAAERLAAAIAELPPLTGPVAAQIAGRTVFVGTNAQATYDLKSFPVAEKEAGVLIHWTAWANLSASGFITTVPAAVPFALAAVILGGLAAIARRARGLAGMTKPILAAFGLLALLACAAYVLPSFGWWLPPTLPAAAALVMIAIVAIESFLLESGRKRAVEAMFGVYVDPGVVERLVSDPEALRAGGERREATVFFCDLAGFTDFSEKLPPEQLLEVVNTYLDETSEALIARGAFIDKYIGDAVMAVFGAPAPHADPVDAACAGALATRSIVEKLNQRLRPILGDTELSVRVGINTGQMTVGNLGSTRKMNYTVLGDTVNLASRLEGANKEFGTAIMLGEETARRVSSAYATRPLTRLRVKGKLTAIEVHELVGETTSLDEPQRAFLAAYREGYAHFCAQRFSLATPLFEQALEHRPNDVATLAHLADARTFQTAAPFPDWQPLQQLTKK
jgi:adenylate cyclase